MLQHHNYLPTMNRGPFISKTTFLSWMGFAQN